MMDAMRFPARALLLAPALIGLGALLLPAALAGDGPDEAAAIRLLVRGDDMGFSRASNPAHIRCYRDGVMRIGL